MNIITIAAVCASVLSHGDHLTTAYKCDSIITGGVTTAQETKAAPVAPEPTAAPKPKAKKKMVSATRHCPAGKHAYFHRRKSKTWWTCA